MVHRHGRGCGAPTGTRDPSRPRVGRAGADRGRGRDQGLRARLVSPATPAARSPRTPGSRRRCAGRLLCCAPCNGTSPTEAGSCASSGLRSSTRSPTSVLDTTAAAPPSPMPGPLGPKQHASGCVQRVAAASCDPALGQGSVTRVTRLRRPNAQARHLPVQRGIALPERVGLVGCEHDVANPEAHRGARHSDGPRDFLDRLSLLATQGAGLVALSYLHQTRTSVRVAQDGSGRRESNSRRLGGNQKLCH